jgi:acyl-coenzyme A synthetase/AMP-(fatty) acid ligase
MHVAASVVDAHKLTRADRGYCSLPLFHVNAEVVGVLATLAAGAYLTLDSQFTYSRTGLWEIIGERRITWISAVPRSSRSCRWTRRPPCPPGCDSSGRRPRRCRSPRCGSSRARSVCRSWRPTG